VNSIHLLQLWVVSLALMGSFSGVGVDLVGFFFHFFGEIREILRQNVVEFRTLRLLRAPVFASARLPCNPLVSSDCVDLTTCEIILFGSLSGCGLWSQCVPLCVLWPHAAFVLVPRRTPKASNSAEFGASSPRPLPDWTPSLLVRNSDVSF